MKDNLTYGQVMSLAKIEDKVIEHIKEKYPNNYYGNPNNILGRYGHGLSKTSWKKVEKLAKFDTILTCLICEYKLKELELGIF